jgi:predicted glycoside hydrolase/deacetylase ChbG (UPF0249 family)
MFDVIDRDVCPRLSEKSQTLVFTRRPILCKKESVREQSIFVADDLGANAKINEAILHTYASGALQAAALMMGQPGTEEAVAMARAYPGLRTGWHLHLNDSLPTTRGQWPWGASPARAGLSIAFSRRAGELMRREVAHQWELYRESGLPCHFINSHHHLHAHPAVFRALTEIIGPDFKGWIRLGTVRFFQPAFHLIDKSRLVDAFFLRQRKLSTWRSPDTLWGLDRTFAMRADEVRAAMSMLPEGFHEFLFHPRNLSCPDTRCLLDLRSNPMA